MKSILYSSKATEPFTGQELKELAILSSKNNIELAISGYLYYNKQSFLQYIEGSSNAVDNLVLKIKKDPRHSFIMSIEDYDLKKRRFPDWGMKSIADVMFKNSVVETTIIQTLSVFGTSNIELNLSSKHQLFKLMDQLSRSLQS